MIHMVARSGGGAVAESGKRSLCCCSREGVVRSEEGEVAYANNSKVLATLKTLAFSLPGTNLDAIPIEWRPMIGQPLP